MPKIAKIKTAPKTAKSPKPQKRKLVIYSSSEDDTKIVSHSLKTKNPKSKFPPKAEQKHPNARKLFDSILSQSKSTESEKSTESVASVASVQMARNGSERGYDSDSFSFHASKVSPLKPQSAAAGIENNDVFDRAESDSNEDASQLLVQKESANLNSSTPEIDSENDNNKLPSQSKKAAAKPSTNLTESSPKSSLAPIKGTIRFGSRRGLLQPKNCETLFDMAFGQSHPLKKAKTVKGKTIATSVHKASIRSKTTTAASHADGPPTGSLSSNTRSAVVPQPLLLTESISLNNDREHSPFLLAAPSHPERMKTSTPVAMYNDRAQTQSDHQPISVQLDPSNQSPFDCVLSPNVSEVRWPSAVGDSEFGLRPPSRFVNSQEIVADTLSLNDD